MSSFRLICQAAKDGDERLLQLLKDVYKSVDIPDSDGEKFRTPAFQLAFDGEFLAVNLLIKFGASIPLIVRGLTRRGFVKQALALAQLNGFDNNIINGAMLGLAEGEYDVYFDFYYNQYSEQINLIRIIGELILCNNETKACKYLEKFSLKINFTELVIYLSNGASKQALCLAEKYLKMHKEKVDASKLPDLLKSVINVSGSKRGKLDKLPTEDDDAKKMQKKTKSIDNTIDSLKGIYCANQDEIAKLSTVVLEQAALIRILENNASVLNASPSPNNNSFFASGPPLPASVIATMAQSARQSSISSPASVGNPGPHSLFAQETTPSYYPFSIQSPQRMFSSVITIPTNQAARSSANSANSDRQNVASTSHASTVAHAAMGQQPVVQSAGAITGGGREDAKTATTTSSSTFSRSI